MDVVLSLMVTVVGGIMSHYIIKWLDSNHDDNQPKEPFGEAAPEGSALCFWTHSAFVVSGDSISYVKVLFNILYTAQIEKMSTEFDNHTI